MKKPNYFIIGAPKCGTTSLASWLSQHPQAFLTTPKEPMFFNTDFGPKNTRRLADYEALFDAATDRHVAVGEASTFYLCSRAAVPNILEYVPDAKFIVMLRKPQEMVVSLHAQGCRGFEDQRDFETAWRLQGERAAGSSLPPFLQHPELCQYGARCRVGSQLEALLGQVAKSQVLVLFLEDIKRSPDNELTKVLRFLGLRQIPTGHFAKKNERARTRSFAIKNVLNGLGHVKRLAGVRVSTGLLAPLYRLNTAPENLPKALSTELHREIDEYFENEIRLVQSVVGRVPDSWLDRRP